MTIRVDYYLLDQSDSRAVHHSACRRLNKAYPAGLRVYVLTETPAQSRSLDELLWSFSDANFVPHALVESADALDPLTRVCMGERLEGVSGFDMLVNMKNAPQLQSTEFTRVAELVSADEAHRQLARRRYAAWRNSGAELNLHEIRIH